MVKINIIYDDFEDVDIITIPDSISTKIETFAQQFCDWLSSPEADGDYYTIIDGRKCAICETEGFVNWLNRTICTGEEKAEIIQEHVKYIPEYDLVEF